jgi:NADPH:quinone reductase-like Zn-dependent oxidoreductase
VKAAIYHEPGVPYVLGYADLADPDLGASDVLIEVQAISIEGGDLIRRRTLQPPRPDYIVGYAAAGVVLAVGRAVTTRKVGDRLTTFASDGSHASLRAVPESQTWIIPDGVDIVDAAALPIAFGTAYHSLFTRGALQAGENVLIQGAAGGVGLAAIQLARRAGAAVIAVSSRANRLTQLIALGATHVVDRRSVDVTKAVLDLTDGRGADLVLDPVGTTLDASLRALAPEGRLVFVGNAGGGALTPDLWPAMQHNQSLLGVFMGTQFSHPTVAATVDRMLADVADTKLKVVIDKSFALKNAAEAHHHAEHGQPFGRVIMRP